MSYIASHLIYSCVKFTLSSSIFDLHNFMSSDVRVTSTCLTLSPIISPHDTSLTSPHAISLFLTSQHISHFTSQCLSHLTSLSLSLTYLSLQQTKPLSFNLTIPVNLSPQYLSHFTKSLSLHLTSCSTQLTSPQTFLSSHLTTLLLPHLTTPHLTTSYLSPHLTLPNLSNLNSSYQILREFLSCSLHDLQSFQPLVIRDKLAVAVVVRSWPKVPPLQHSNHLVCLPLWGQVCQLTTQYHLTVWKSGNR